MKHLYLLKRLDETIVTDQARGFVVCAETPDEARHYAACEAGDEGADVWYDLNKTSCVRLDVGVKLGVVLRDFRDA